MELNICKIVLLGESEVGKTCIINRYLYNIFNSNYQPTIPLNHKEKVINNENYNLKVIFWDTAGQERFNAVSKMIYKNANIIILTYSINDRKSLEKLKEFWYQEISDNTDYQSKILFLLLVLGLIGNKTDLMDKEEVSELEGRSFAKEIKAEFSLCSAKENIGINEYFEYLIQLYAEKTNIQNSFRSSNSVLFNDFVVLEKSIKNNEYKKKKCCSN